MATQERLYSYGEETSPTHKKKRKTKHTEAVRTLKEVGEIVGNTASHVGHLERVAIKKLVLGLKDKGLSYTQSILAVQKFLGVNDPRIILDCLDEDYIENTRQFAKKLDISDM